jgi:hypothetical protein
MRSRFGCRDEELSILCRGCSLFLKSKRHQLELVTLGVEQRQTRAIDLQKMSKAASDGVKEQVGLYRICQQPRDFEHQMLARSRDVDSSLVGPR